MTDTSRLHLKETPPTREERVFLGLVRESVMSAYLGRASMLSDDELRSLFALAKAAMREESAAESEVIVRHRESRRRGVSEPQPHRESGAGEVRPGTVVPPS